MILLPNADLPPAAQQRLAEYQERIDEVTDYKERVTVAKSSFKTKNRKGNATFDAVRTSLTSMCAGAVRCVYCEDSAADEVEHVLPKDFYPERTFDWMNYVYACGPCNGPKGNACAVFDAKGALCIFVRERDAAILPPPAGKSALIDPRTENALDFMTLELRDTFWFLPMGTPGSVSYERARFTINTLHLNDRDLLPKARRAAYRDYRAHLAQYRAARVSGEVQPTLGRLIDEIRSRQHPTVWREMKRQHSSLPDLKSLFTDVPEALTW